MITGIHINVHIGKMKAALNLHLSHHCYQACPHFATHVTFNLLPKFASPNDRYYKVQGQLWTQTRRVPRRKGRFERAALMRNLSAKLMQCPLLSARTLHKTNTFNPSTAATHGTYYDVYFLNALRRN